MSASQQPGAAAVTMTSAVASSPMVSALASSPMVSATENNSLDLL